MAIELLSDGWFGSFQWFIKTTQLIQQYTNSGVESSYKELISLNSIGQFKRLILHLNKSLHYWTNLDPLVILPLNFQGSGSLEYPKIIPHFAINELYHLILCRSSFQILCRSYPNINIFIKKNEIPDKCGIGIRYANKIHLIDL